MATGAIGLGSQRPALPAWRLGQRSTALLLAAPALLFFTFLFVLPLGVMLLISLLSGNPLWDETAHFTLANYSRLIEDSYHLEVMGQTLLLGFWVTAASLVIAYPLAFQLVQVRRPWLRTAMLVAILSPMMTGLVIRTYAWMTILADRGVINEALTAMGLITEPLPLMYNMFGIAVAMVHIFVPFMMLTLVGVLGRIDPALVQAARNLGASGPRAFFEVTLPLSLPGIVAGSLLVFALTISSYVTPTLMGGFSFQTLPMLIYQQIAASFNPGMGAAIGFVLLVVSLLIILAYGRALRHFTRGGAL